MIENHNKIFLDITDLELHRDFLFAFHIQFLDSSYMYK